MNSPPLLFDKPAVGFGVLVVFLLQSPMALIQYSKSNTCGFFEVPKSLYKSITYAYPLGAA